MFSYLWATGCLLQATATNYQWVKAAEVRLAAFFYLTNKQNEQDVKLKATVTGKGKRIAS
ncbi:hypothetical protein DP923_04670 [Pontibacter arcticus]|uniref:Uncharacterized protein n=1 Tax=Pontibacter arcticus TaxID=2080288 RepID=A0A364RJ85_9BACT|nr:hypothetical protein DP923_04670 [Pontibacter arcticus]